jgi:hypothetical protein
MEDKRDQRRPGPSPMSRVATRPDAAHERASYFAPIVNHYFILLTRSFPRVLTLVERTRRPKLEPL